MLFLGLDLSTTGAKALAIDEKRRVLAGENVLLSVQFPQPLTFVGAR